MRKFVFIEWLAAKVSLFSLKIQFNHNSIQLSTEYKTKINFVSNGT